MEDEKYQKEIKGVQQQYQQQTQQQQLDDKLQQRQQLKSNPNLFSKSALLGEEYAVALLVGIVKISASRQP